MRHFKQYYDIYENRKMYFLSQGMQNLKISIQMGKVENNCLTFADGIGNVQEIRSEKRRTSISCSNLTSKFLEFRGRIST